MNNTDRKVEGGIESTTPKLINEPDDLVEGFERLDSKYLESRAPRITLLPKFHEREPKQQIDYLLKLASTMNHAARLIQDERNELVNLMEKKERQLESMAAAMRQNDQMLQQEIARINEQRQAFHQQMADKNKHIKDLERALEHGDNSRLEH